jgi:uncharacterized protein
MQINVAQLLREPVGATREYEIDDVVDITSDGKGSRVKGEVKLLRTQRSILAECALSTDVELACSRCLSPFRYPLEVNFQEEFLPTVDLVSGVALPPPEEAGTFTIDEHHILDLTEAVRQYALLAIPMKPLCREDCAGLCPSCGQNLNRGRCDCPVPSTDPRWSELMKLASGQISQKETE